MNALDQIEVPRRQPPPIAVPSDLGDRIGRLVGIGALVATVVTGFILALDSSQHFSSVVANSWLHFPRWERGPFSFLPGSLLSNGTYSELTYGMFLAFVVALACSRWIASRAAIAALVVLHMIFLLTPPLASTDIWNYIGYSHLGALHGLSPYSHYPIAARHDPAFKWVTWPQLKTPYGPIFTIFTYAIAPLGVAGGLWTLKVLLTAAAGASLWLVWRCAQRLGRNPVTAILLVGLSPAWLIWTVGGAHNDPLMLTLLLVGVWLWLGGRDRLAGFLIVVAAGIKIPAILALPFLALRARDTREMLKGAAAGLVTVVVLTLIAFHSFQPLTAFQEQSSFHTNRSLLGELFRLFGAPLATPSASVPATIVLIAVIVALFQWVRRRRGDPLVATGWAGAGLLAAMLWEFPWYVAWVLPFAALGRDRRLVVATLTIMAVLLVAYVPPYLFLA